MKWSLSGFPSGVFDKSVNYSVGGDEDIKHDSTHALMFRPVGDNIANIKFGGHFNSPVDLAIFVYRLQVTINWR